MVDENTPGPGDGSTSVTPAAQRPMEGRQHAKIGDYVSFLRGDGVTIKAHPNKKVEYGWVIGRGDPVPHEEQPLNDSDTR